LKLKSGIHDFSSYLLAGAQDGTGDGKDHSEFSACPLRLTLPVIVDRVPVFLLLVTIEFWTITAVGAPLAGAPTAMAAMR
jgi:hypothetical protein